MDIDRVRFGRQMRLPEIGEAGQLRLLQSEVRVDSATVSHAVEIGYLTGAGVAVVDGRVRGARAKAAADVEARQCAHVLDSLEVRNGAVREVAGASLRALLTLRNILGLDVVNAAKSR